MAARKAPTRRASKRSVKRPATKSAKRRSKPTANRSLNQILMDLGRQYLIDGVKEVLAEEGIDTDTVQVAITKPRRSSKVKKPSRRR